MPELRQHRRRGLRAPARESRIAVRRIADQRQLIRDRRRRHAELRDDAGFVARSRRADRAARCASPRTHCARSLSGVQINTCDTRGSAAAIAAAAASASSASNSTIGHTVTPNATQRVLEQMELRRAVRLDAVAGLVAGPQLVAKRFDHVIGGDADMRRDAAVQHAADRAKHARARPPLRCRSCPAPWAPRSSAGTARRFRR